MKKTGFEVIFELLGVLFAVLVMVWLILALLSGIKGFTKELFFEESEVYTVEAGDTLWSVCKTYKPEDMDLREYIFEVCKFNNCTPKIRAGQKITMLKVK